MIVTRPGTARALETAEKGGSDKTLKPICRSLAATTFLRSGSNCVTRGFVTIKVYGLLRLSLRDSGGILSALFEHALHGMSETRSNFGCEAEFQLELAVWFRLHMPTVEVRLERNAYQNGRKRLDMSLSLPRSRTAVELKYAPVSSAANDVYRHGFLKDIERLESLCEDPKWDRGYAILLSERPACWERGNQNVTDREFHLFESRRLHGNLSWTEGTSRKTLKAYPSIQLRGHYTCHWRQYGEGRLKYLVIGVH